MAATVTWTGASDGNWFNSLNWFPAQVPTLADDAIIDLNNQVSATGVTSISFATLTLGDPSAHFSPTLRISAAESTSGSVTVSSGATLQQDTTQQIGFGTLTVMSGGVLTHTANISTLSHLINLNVAGDFNLQSGAAIVVDAMGYSGNGGSHAGFGPGGGGTGGARSGGGGGHGGAGGASSDGSTGGAGYDSVTNPTDLGSGGGGSTLGGGVSGGAGGGAALIQVGGLLTLNGLISANGTPGSADSYWGQGGGGGGGGTVNISAVNITGSGTLRANGGSGTYLGGAGGGGGRITVAVAGSDSSSLNISANSGSIVSNSGAPFNGGAGVIAIKTNGAVNYSLIIGNSLTDSQANTPITGSPSIFSSVAVYNSTVTFDAGSTTNITALVAAGTVTMQASNLTAGSFIVTGPLNLTVGALTLGANPLEIRSGGTLALAANSLSNCNLIVRNGGVFEQMNTLSLNVLSIEVDAGGQMAHGPNTTTQSALLNLNVSGDLTLQAGATITADGSGYSGATVARQKGSGPGGGMGGPDGVAQYGSGYAYGSAGAGGGHGGAGGAGAAAATGGISNDSLLTPTDLGSGGGSSGNGDPGGNGGGAIILQVGGTLNLNGLVTTSGMQGGTDSYYGTAGGGGSGGTINITVANLAGSGMLRANGGAGGSQNQAFSGGGGGGGRVALVVTGSDASSLSVLALPGRSGGTLGLNGGAGVIVERGPGATSYTLAVGSSAVVAQAVTPIPGSAVTFSLVTLNNSTVTFDAGSTTSIGSLVAAGSVTLRAPSLTAGSFIVTGSANLTVGALTLGANPLEIRGGGLLALSASSLSNCNLIVRNGGAFEQTNALSMNFQSIEVDSGGQLTHGPNAITQSALLNLNVLGDFTLSPGAMIAIDGLGYSGGAAQGGAAQQAGYGSGGGGAGGNGSGAGGGHGGGGGNGDGSGIGGVSNDVLTNPTDLGSGGAGSSTAGGSSGGGAAVIQVGGLFTVGGSISANGTNSIPETYYATGGGAGSGGTINITANNLTGAGTVKANGGNGSGYGGAGGGGGLIAIVVSGTDSSSLNIAANNGTIVNNGRGGIPFNGGAGVIAIKNNGAANYSLIIGSASTTAQGVTTIFGATPVFDQITLYNSTVAFVSGAANIGTLVAAGTVTIQAPGFTAGSFIVNGPMNLTIGALTLGANPLEIRAGGLLALAASSLSNCNLIVRNGGVFKQTNTLPLNFTSIQVDSGGQLTHGPNGTSQSALLNLNVSGNFNVQAGAVILADGLGYSGYGGSHVGAGPGGGGTGGSKSGGGGGHGGVGGSSTDGSPGGATYDSALFPSQLGSQGGGSTQGGGAPGGAGGGEVLIQVGGILTLNGLISANGSTGSAESYYGSGGGGGGGGTINVSAANFAGSAILRAAGGTGSGYGGSGGGGGRIALSYGARTASLTLSVAGGTGNGSGNAGNVGTILDASQLSGFTTAGSTPTASISQLQGTLAASQSLSETLFAQSLNFSGGTSTGVTTGSFSQAQVQLVTLQTGSLAGNGFFNGNWTLGFPSGDFLSGLWQGAAYLKTSPRQMVLKGVIEGEIRGVLEGVLTESVSGSGIFDRMSVNCSAIQIGNQAGATALYFTASAPSPQTAQYAGTPLNLLQTSLTGQTSGYYTNPIENTFTLVTVNSPGNPYNGEGFFLPTYSSPLGTGVGWAYAQTNYGQIARLSGLLDQPLRSLFEGVLVTNSPRSELLTLERLDVGAAVQPILNLATTRPGVATPGQTDAFSITIRNDGYAAASNVTVIAILPEWADFVSASGVYTVYNVEYWRATQLYAPTPLIRWDVGQVPPRTTLTFNYQGRFRLLASGGPVAHELIAGGDVELVTKAWANQVFANYPVGGNP